MKLKMIILSALVASAPALAHEAKGPNGGRIVDAGSYHVELVANDTLVELHVTDSDDKPVPAQGFKGTAILIIDGKPLRIALEPAAGNLLSGKAPAALPKEPKGAVQLTAPDGKTASAKIN